MQTHPAVEGRIRTPGLPPDRSTQVCGDERGATICGSQGGGPFVAASGLLADSARPFHRHSEAPSGRRRNLSVLGGAARRRTDRSLRGVPQSGTSLRMTPGGRCRAGKGAACRVGIRLLQGARFLGLSRLSICRTAGPRLWSRVECSGPSLWRVLGIEEPNDFLDRLPALVVVQQMVIRAVVGDHSLLRRGHALHECARAHAGSRLVAR